MLARITSRTNAEEARNPTVNIALKARDRRWSWLGHALRMPEHRLGRRVLLNSVKPTNETLFADIQTYTIGLDDILIINILRQLAKCQRTGSCGEVVGLTAFQSSTRGVAIK